MLNHVASKEIDLIRGLLCSDRSWATFCVLWLLIIFSACATPPYLTVSPSFTLGAIKVQVPDEYRKKERFRKNVRSYFNELQKNPHLRQILQAAQNAPVQIIITPITDDPGTWHSSGSRTRSHTDPLDNFPKKYGRKKPTPSVIFINPTRIDPSHRSYPRGTLAHELVHAIDLAYGRYNLDSEIRERRAVFVQNIWRDLYAYRLRVMYHKRFLTIEYQSAKEKGMIRDYLNHIFTGDTFPLPIE